MSALKSSPRLNDAENDFMTSALQDECMEHALVERQIPMALGAGFGVWSLDRFGLWPRSMRGPYLGINLVGAVAVGFVLGRFSYLNECRKRLGLDGANQSTRTTSSRSRDQMEALYQHRFQREGVPKSLAEVKDEGEEETDLFRQPELYQDQRPAPGSWAGNGELPRPPRTTYDQLRMQHREAELKKSFRRTPSQLPLAESGPNEGGDDADTRRNNSYERLRYQHRERELKKSFGGTPSQLSYGDSGASEDIDDANSGKNNNYENREREFKKNLSHLLGLGYPDKLGRPTSGGGEKAPEQSVDRSRRKMFNQYGDEILPER